jgi:hypothetical protein
MNYCENSNRFLNNALYFSSDFNNNFCKAFMKTTEIINTYKQKTDVYTEIININRKQMYMVMPDMTGY